MCYYRGYYSGNNYNASVVWPQFVLMLCLLGKNSGGQSIRWSPGYRESIDTWGDWEGDRGLSDQICLVPPSTVGENRNLHHQLFNWNILGDSFLSYFEEFLNIHLNQILCLRAGSGRALVTTVFTLVNSLNIALTQLLIPALTYQHPSPRQPSSPSVAE